MTPEQLAEIESSHFISDEGNYCSNCGEDDPCTVTRLAAEIRRLHDALSVTAQMAAQFSDEMLHAQGRAERAEAEHDRR